MNGRITLFALVSLIAWPFGSLALPRQPLPPLPEWALARWRFDEALRQYPFNAAPASIPEASLGESWSGYALRRAGERVTPFALPEVAASHQINFTPGSGAIRFWFKPAWGSPDAGYQGSRRYARLLELVSLGADRSTPAVQWSLYAAPDGSALYVSGQGSQGSRDYLRAAIEWPADTWHLVLLAYTPTSSALYLDGELAAAGDPLPVPPAPTAPALALVLGSDITGAFPAQGDFDELTTFDREPDSQHLTWYYQAYAARAAQGPVTEAEILATQALRVALAQQRAERDAALQNSGAQMAMMIVGGTSLCLSNVPVFITNIVSTWITNQGWTVTFDIQGGTNGDFYDIFTTGSLIGNSITNARWTWLEQGPTCSRYQYTDQPGASAFYVLGTQKNSDNDLLTDAFEQLVTKSNPELANTDGDDLDDYWEWRLGRNPNVSNTVPDASALIGFQVFTPLQ